MAYAELLKMHWEAIPPEKQKQLADEVSHAVRGGTNFNSLLVNLVVKSDVQNLLKLFHEYPDLVSAAHAFSNGIILYKDWQEVEKKQAAQAAVFVDLTDAETHKMHKVRLRVVNDTIGMLVDGGGNNGAFDHVAVEVNDGMLKVHVWTDGIDAPNTIRIDLSVLHDENNDNPYIEYEEGEQ